MPAMTAAAVLTLANVCVGPALAPIMTGIALHESGGDPAIVNRNTNGTIDAGLVQVNSSNFGWLGLTMESALDPCKNLVAGARVLFVKYNGHPPPEAAAAYSDDVMRRIASLDRGAAPPLPASAEPINDEPALAGEIFFNEGKSQ